MLLIIYFTLTIIVLEYIWTSAMPFVPQSVLKAFIMLEWFRFHVSKLNVRNILFVRECTHSLLTSFFNNAMLCDHNIWICTWKIRINVILLYELVWKINFCTKIHFSYGKVQFDYHTLYCIMIFITLVFSFTINTVSSSLSECHWV